MTSPDELRTARAYLASVAEPPSPALVDFVEQVGPVEAAARTASLLAAGGVDASATSLTGFAARRASFPTGFAASRIACFGAAGATVAGTGAGARLATTRFSVRGSTSMFHSPATMLDADSPPAVGQSRGLATLGSSVRACTEVLDGSNLS